MSERCAWEVERTDLLKKRLLPIVWRGVDEASVPSRLKRLNYIFFDRPHAFGPSLATLAKALRTDLGSIREHTRLGEIALRWHARGRGGSAVDWGEELFGAKDWLSRQPSYAPEPTLLVREFINASDEMELARTNAERKRLEEMALAQADRERALTQAEASQKAREAAQLATARAQRRNSLLIFAAAFLALILLVGALWQSKGKRKARKHRPN